MLVSSIASDFSRTLAEENDSNAAYSAMGSEHVEENCD
jgi:hypothetical protein